MHWTAALVVAALGIPAGGMVSLTIGALSDAAGPRTPLAPRSPALAPVPRFGPVLVTATAFGAMGLRFGASPVLPAFCYLAAVAVALSYLDVRYRRLPDVLTLTGYPVAIALLGAATVFLPNGAALLRHALFGAVVAGAFYLLLAVIYPAGLGWGDVKLSGVLGLYLGWLGARAFVAGLAGGFVLAALAGVALIAVGVATRKTQLPFGPFMLVATVAAVLAGPVLSG